MSLWNDSYLTGNEEVDNDHREIFSLVENVLSAADLSRKDKVEAAVGFLGEYVKTHFDRERALMEECDYPDIEAHCAEHAALLDAAASLQENFSPGGSFFGGDAGNDLSLSMEINKTIVTWLANHVMDDDKKMAQFYRDWCARAGRTADSVNT